MKPSRLLALLAAALFSQSALALQINLTYTTDGQAGSVPGLDSDGSRLMELAQAAATYWEGIIKDAHTLNLIIRYDNGIGTGFIGLFTETAESNGRVDSGTIGIRGTTPWFYDPTPTNHSEFAMAQTLYRDAQGGDAANFAGAVPGVLEINFVGIAGPGAPFVAQNNTDLLSVLLHEMGHALGMTLQLSACATELNDNLYDINPAHTNGNVMTAVLGGTTGAHTACLQCLMNPAIGTGRRRLPSAADVLALATCPSPGWSQIDLPRKDFLPGGTTIWNTAANWVGGRLPDSADDTSIRYGIDVPGDPLISLSADGVCRSLLLSGATRLRTFAHKLDATSTVTLDFDGNLPAPEIFVEAGGELESGDVIANGGEINMTGGLLDLADDLFLSDDTPGRIGILTGHGTVEVEGTLSNNGRIDAGGGNTLVFNSGAFAPWDLDGSTGNGEVLALLGSLNFATGAMSDAFDGLLQVEDPYSVTFGEAWSLGAGGLVKLNGGDASNATLGGAFFQALTGDIQVTGRGRITAPVEFGGSLELVVAADGRLLMDGLATVTGGGYLLGAGATMEFNNSTHISDGIFIIPATATVRLDGTHTLEGGSFSGLGTLQFNGQTIINQPVTIECEVLDFDGPGGAKQVDVNAALIINSDQLDLSNNQFDATLNIGPAPARLEVNTPAAWTMAGTLNHATASNVYATSLSGAAVTLSGTVNVSGSTRWDARATLSGTLNLLAPADRLELRGGSANDPNALLGGTVNGGGVLRALNTSLRGFGTIQPNIDFAAGSALFADNGLLRLTGSFITVPPILGTADGDGILEVVNNWTLTAGSQLALNGGIVRGGTVNNRGHIAGYGTLQSADLINNAVIGAEAGQTLTIDTVGSPDLDGLGTVPEVAAHLLEAMNGNVTITKTPGDAFGAMLRIGPGRTATFQGGWTLDTPGTMNMSGNTAANPAVLAGGGAILRGSVILNDHCRFNAPAFFESGSVTTVDEPGDSLLLEKNSVIRAGAVFTGFGRIVTTNASTLTLDPAADVGVSLVNEMARIELANGPGKAKTKSFTQSGAGTLGVEILGAPGSSDWDQLTVTGTATLSGRLDVNFNVAGAQIGDTWKVLTAGAIAGSFSQLTTAGVPAGKQLLVLQTNDGVYLKLSGAMKYADWAAAAGLTPGNDGLADDPDGDLIPNGLEMFLGLNPLSAEFTLMPAAEIVKVDGLYYLAITLPVSTEITPSDLQLSVLRSTDLETWSTDNTVIEVISYDLEQCHEFRRFRSTIPYDVQEQEFLRIKVTGP